ncbi:hypothetical protein RRF57_008063 [Xylaria bambusicola]|uniref:Uncharacterized protein n=1 Tax=Xylaria bambusicola TaxID=326684 RepID=A0AAN7URF9_9PEZI
MDIWNAYISIASRNIQPPLQLALLLQDLELEAFDAVLQGVAALFHDAGAEFRVSSNTFLFLAALALLREDVEPEFSRRPCCSSARARSDSMRRSTRSMCASARSRSVVMAGESSERSEASAAWSVVCGISS